MQAQVTALNEAEIDELCPGLDDEAKARIVAVAPSVLSLIATLLAKGTSSSGDLLPAEILEKSSSPLNPDSLSLFLERHAHHVAAVARTFSFDKQAQSAILRRLMHRGYIVNPETGAKSPSSTVTAEIVSAVSSLLEHNPFPTGKNSYKSLLQQKGYCLTRDMADQVARVWSKCERDASAKVRGLILAIHEFGLLGVLKGTNYPYTYELLDLRRLFKSIPGLRDLPPPVEIALRQIIIAVRRAFEEHAPGMWNVVLIQDPKDGHNRQQYRRILEDSGKQHNIMEGVAAQLGVSIDESSTWLVALLDGGWNRLIERAVQNHGLQLEASVQVLRLRRIAERNFGPLDRPTQDLVIQRSLDLVEASRGIIDTPNVNDILASRNHRRTYKAFRAQARSLGSPQRLSISRSRRKNHSPHNLSRRFKIESDDQQSRTVKPLEKVVSAFSERLNFGEEQEARNILIRTGWNGSLGLLTSEELNQSIHPRIQDYIRFIKFGHVDGAVDHTALCQRVNDLAHIYGCLEWSPSFARQYYSSLPKPRRWNGGVGDVMAGVQWRATRFRSERRLHKCWHVCHLELNMPSADPRDHFQTEKYHALVVVENATTRGMGVWVSNKPPSQNELGLALFQSIWHPDCLDWPLRGIPERICVPSKLLSSDAQWRKRVSHFLLTEIVADDEGTSMEAFAENGVIERLQILAPRILRQELGNNPFPLSKIQHSLSKWLCSEEWFPHHTITPVPASWSLALPGDKTPAAGWLLPRTELVQVTSAGVLDRGALFTTQQPFQEQLGTQLWKREYSGYYAGKDASFFVESSDGNLLYYFQ